MPTYTDFATKNGSTTNATEVADNFYLMFGRQFARDMTGGTANTSSYTQIGTTLSVSANACDDHVYVIVHLTGTWAFVTSGTADHTTQYDIRIGETGSEVSKQARTIPGGEGGGANHNGTMDVLDIYYYEPTTAEKSNGFNVKLYGKYTTSGGTGSGTVTLVKAYVVGN